MGRLTRHVLILSRHVECAISAAASRERPVDPRHYSSASRPGFPSSGTAKLGSRIRVSPMLVPMPVSMAVITHRSTPCQVFPQSRGFASSRVTMRSVTPPIQTSSTAPGPPSQPTSSESSLPSPTPRSSLKDLSPSSSSSPSSPSGTQPPPPVPRSSLVSRYTPRLASLSARTGVPLSSLAAAFLVLHELTAIVPLVLIFFLLQALGAGAGLVEWLEGVAEDDASVASGDANANDGWDVQSTLRRWLKEGEEKVGKVGKRYGILGYTRRDQNGISEMETSPVREDDSMRMEGGSRAVDKVASAVVAYIIVKTLIPFRIAVSLTLAPAFARLVMRPVGRLIGRPLWGVRR